MGSCENVMWPCVMLSNGVRTHVFCSFRFSSRVGPVHTGVSSISRVRADLTTQAGPDRTAATLLMVN